jgi:Fe-S-cluster containining protein
MKKSSIENLKRAILDDYPHLTPEDCFAFRCSRELSCFNQCCADVNIALTPYDVIRMKQRLDLDSGEFLRRHTVAPFSKDQTFPVVFLKMGPDERKTCPFVQPSGCSIYSDRPWACRMYPIGVASPAQPDQERFFFLIREEPCAGHEQDRNWTIRDWMEDQGVATYEQVGEEFKSITLHPFFQKGGRLDPAKMEMLFMVLYDIDKFRRFVFESTFLEKFEVSQEDRRRAEEDDLELLRLGFSWLRFCLFGEPVMQIKTKVEPGKQDPKEASASADARPVRAQRRGRCL